MVVAHARTPPGLLADALGLAGRARELFVAAARGRGPAEDVLAAREGRVPGAGDGARSMHGCPYRGLLPVSPRVGRPGQRDCRC
jgi:hypothetical protein